MTKKIIDIVPPENVKKEEEEKKVLPVPKRDSKIPKTSLPTFDIFGILQGFKKKQFLLLTILFLAGIFSIFILPKAEIIIEPDSEIESFDTNLTVDTKLTTADFASAVIPGRMFELEKEVVDEFPATGKAIEEKKAEGIIRVYNAYSTSPQVLVATTRFVSADGKLFRSIERVTIPGGHYEGGKFVPGFLDIKVRADKPGEEYNIEPTTFSIPGFAGTPRYTYFYGKSFQPMTGGVKREVQVVTEEDLSNAREKLIEKATTECNLALQEEIPPEFTALESLQKIEIIETSSSANAGEKVDSFTFKVKAHKKAIAFKKEDIQNFVKQYISFQIPTDQKLYQESLKINYFAKNVDFENGKATLSLVIKAIVYSDIDTLTTKRVLKGKTLNETKMFLESRPEVNKSSVSFWPFWVKKVPQDESKIYIRLKIPEGVD
ncbi:hypothetical protein J7L36_00395 [bacterium]|nr:hypothetical protein [bacterium]